MLLKIQLNPSISLIKKFFKSDYLYIWEGDVLAHVSTSLSSGIFEIIKLMQPFSFTLIGISCAHCHMTRILMQVCIFHLCIHTSTVVDLVSILWFFIFYLLAMPSVGFEVSFEAIHYLLLFPSITVICLDGCQILMSGIAMKDILNGDTWWHECDCMNLRMRTKFGLIYRNEMANSYSYSENLHNIA